MFETELKINRFLLQYAHLLTNDIPDERFAEQPLPGVNHPAWIIGHIAVTGDFVSSICGGQKHCPETWGKQFGPGSVMTGNRGDYPSKAELIQTLDRAFLAAHEVVPSATEEQLARPNPNRRMREGLPTLREACAFLLTGHFGVHLGQLSAWRRMIGVSPLF